jgi:taurine dioxygenase
MASTSCQHPETGRAMSVPMLTIKRLGVHLGAEVVGLDLSAPLGDAVTAAVRQALLKYQVLVFRNQDISANQLLTFGRSFGPLSVAPITPHNEDLPELGILDNGEHNPASYVQKWHIDESYREEPPMGTMLRSIVIPETGGDTLFVSMTAAYEGLSDRIKAYLVDLEAVFDHKYLKRRIGTDAEGRLRQEHFARVFPRVTHPVVREHPETSEKILFVNPNCTLYIKGIDDVESQAILSILFHQADIPEYQYRHRWEPNMVVFWDNRSTQHRAPQDYKERRVMHRITIKGSRPYASGRKESFPSQSSRQ